VVSLTARRRHCAKTDITDAQAIVAKTLGRPRPGSTTTIPREPGRNCRCGAHASNHLFCNGSGTWPRPTLKRSLAAFTKAGPLEAP
jgi:hypothetical protein